MSTGSGQAAWGLLGSVIICSGLSKAFSRACYKGSRLSAGLSMSQSGLSIKPVSDDRVACRYSVAKTRHRVPVTSF